MNKLAAKLCLLRNFFLVLIAAVSFLTAAADEKENYSRVKILFDKQHDMAKLGRLGVAVDHGDYRKGKYFISDYSESEIRTIKRAGFKVQVIIKDVIKYYEENSRPSGRPQQKMSSVPCDTIGMPVIGTPTRFHLGNYGGHFGYNEMLAIIDSMQLLYPNLISIKQPIGSFQTIEGRPIYWIRVSNNPSVSQPAKPQILYTALHHAREPGSLTATIFYLWYLLEHYNTDPQIQAIINNAELYFIPCVNPDGYLFNIANNPTGGGMWRKNRRVNANATFGVDLNRNYGYLWGFDNLGSSNQGTSDTYRGTAAFSEPETQAVKWFCEQHHFGLALNYHTFNNELLNPYGHVPVANTPDSLAISAYSMLLTKNNFYRYGTCYECLGYVANGGSDDWMYGEQTTKNKIISWTPEIGEVQSGFYPPISQIMPDCKKNLLTNVNAAALILPYARITSQDENILTKLNGYLHYSIQRLGLKDTATYTVTAQALDNWITIPPVTKTYTNPALLQNILDSISYTLNPATPNKQAIRYVLKINNGLYDIRDTVQFFFGKAYTITNIPTSSFTNWINNGWSVNTQVFHSSPSSLKSSLPNSNYSDNDFISITLKDTIDLTKAVKAYLQFYAKWDIEPKYDYALVEVNQVGTWNWTALCGKYTKPGDYDQPTDAPVYDDHQYGWLLEQMDLGAYMGKKINLRFSLTSDQGQTYSGIYIDDVQVRMIRDTVTGVTDVVANEGIAVYPNPANDRVSVVLGDNYSGISTLSLYDGIGRKVASSTFTHKTTINVSGLANGLYYLHVYNKERSLPVQKIELLK
jgi:carboxypeptidase T